jgi:molecular chaperone DnaJ
VAQQQGFFAMRTTCPACRGTGERIEVACRTCQGEGRVPLEREVTVTIPPGVEDGMQLRLQGEGEAAPRGGPRGDLYVEIHVRQHALFRRSGEDVLLEIPVGFAQAALGAEIEVPTLKGRSTLAIPKGTQPGTVLRMRGLGLPRLDGYGVGNQMVRIAVEVPAKLSKAQEELLRRYAELEAQQVGTRQKGFWDKVREILGS